MNTIPGTTLPKVGDFRSPPFIRRSELNPILSAKHMPYPSHLVFNSSVVVRGGRYLMMFRNEVYEREGVPKGKIAHLGIAESDDGLHWTPWPQPLDLNVGIVDNNAYDPRVVPLEGKYYISLCQGNRFSCQAAILVTEDFRRFDLFDVAPPCSRNIVLFPEKIGNYYYRLERPFWQPVDSHLHKANEWISNPYSIWIARSPDLKHWGDYKPLLECSDFDFANIKIGPGGHPLRTAAGWLVLVHGVDWDPTRGKNGWQDAWRNRYHAGAALLDLDDPSKVIAHARKPLLTPEAPYERTGGWRNDVIFPMATIPQPDGSLYIYYGAADTHTCLATCKLDDLIEFCRRG
ncbi:MAG: glycoside hydrolase family 130 protein [Candidatus Sumerlaeota bacterium]|nr:glycoside hydrolase family 130 protein [Candidatus Sumerlaeota bacterium]